MYCKFHYLEGHETNSAEEELLGFLLKFPSKDWKWSDQYESEDGADDSIENEERELKNKQYKNNFLIVPFYFQQIVEEKLYMMTIIIATKSLLSFSFLMQKLLIQVMEIGFLRANMNVI